MEHDPLSQRQATEATTEPMLWDLKRGPGCRDLSNSSAGEALAQRSGGYGYPLSASWSTGVLRVISDFRDFTSIRLRSAYGTNESARG